MIYHPTFVQILLSKKKIKENTLIRFQQIKIYIKIKVDYLFYCFRKLEKYESGELLFGNFDCILGATSKFYVIKQTILACLLYVE